MRFPHDPFTLDDLHWPALYARVETRPGYPVLAQTDAARAVAMALQRTSRAFDVEPIAYCLMPNHVHLVLAGRAADADARTALRRWKQLSGAEHRLRTGQTLWRPKCAEHLLREPAEMWEAVAYLVEEPVRAGLVRLAGEHRWLSAPDFAARRLWRCSSRPAARPDWWPDRITSGCRSGYSSPR